MNPIPKKLNKNLFLTIYQIVKDSQGLGELYYHSLQCRRCPRAH